MAQEEDAGLHIHTELHVLQSADSGAEAGNGPSCSAEDEERLVLIMGFGASLHAWMPMLAKLEALWAQQPGPPLSVLLLDNRGVGKSSCPTRKSQYSTTLMAKDVLAAMDARGWDSCHVAGFSMGGMVATKLAALAPKRVQSLVLMSVSGGGMDAVPYSWRAFKYLLMVLQAKTDAARARMDLKFHFTKTTLRRMVPEAGRSAREVLHEEYVSSVRTHGRQPKAGHKGQAHAVWEHDVPEEDVRRVKSGGFPIWFIHGRKDLVAMPDRAERLARRFGAPCVMLQGAHFIPRENAGEVAELLRSIVRNHVRLHAAHAKSPADAMQLRVGTSSQGQEKEAGQLQLVLSATTSGPAGAAASS